MMDKWTNWKNAWNAQPRSDDENFPLMTLRQLEERDEKLARQIKRRNLLEWIACALVVLVFGHRLWNAQTTLAAIGSSVLMLAGPWIAAFLFARGRYTRPLDATLDSAEFLARFAHQLDNQIRLLRRAPYWYLGPIAVGFALLLVDGFSIALDKGATPGAWFALAASAAFCLVVVIGVGLLNRKAAQKLARLRQKIDTGALS